MLHFGINTKSINKSKLIFLYFRFDCDFKRIVKLNACKMESKDHIIESFKLPFLRDGYLDAVKLILFIKKYS